MAQLKDLMVMGATKLQGNLNVGGEISASSYSGTMSLGTAQGDSLYITDSARYPIQSITLYSKGLTPRNGFGYSQNDRHGGHYSIMFRITGKNIFDGIIESGTIDINTGKNVENSDRYRSKNFIPVEYGKTYIFSTDGVNKRQNVVYYGTSKEYICSGGTGNTFTVPNQKIAYMKFFYDNTILGTNYQWEEGSVVTSYEEYQEVSETKLFTYDDEAIFLNGIKVSSGGNYIDDDNQQWISDELCVSANSAYKITNVSSSGTSGTKLTTPIKRELSEDSNRFIRELRNLITYNPNTRISTKCTGSEVSGNSLGVKINYVKGTPISDNTKLNQSDGIVRFTVKLAVDDWHDEDHYLNDFSDDSPDSNQAQLLNYLGGYSQSVLTCPEVNAKKYEFSLQGAVASSNQESNDVIQETLDIINDGMILYNDFTYNSNKKWYADGRLSFFISQLPTSDIELVFYGKEVS